MKRRFAEDAAVFRPRAGFEQKESYVLRAQASCADERRISLRAIPAIALVVEIRPGGNQCGDQLQGAVFRQRTGKDHVGDVVQRMGESLIFLPPADQRIGG